MPALTIVQGKSAGSEQWLLLDGVLIYSAFFNGWLKIKMFTLLWIWEQHEIFEQAEDCTVVHRKELVNHCILQSSFLGKSDTSYEGFRGHSGLLIFTPCLGPFSNFPVYNHNAKTISLWSLRNFVISLGFTAFAVSPTSCTLPSQWVLQPPPLPNPRLPQSLFGKRIPSNLLRLKVASASCGSKNFPFPCSHPFLQLGHYKLVTHL